MRAQMLLGSWVVLVLLGGCESSQAPTTGALRLIMYTTGGDLDLDGYVATVDNAAHAVPINGVVVVPDLGAGAHDVAFGGVAANCASTAATHTPTVRAGDTTSVTFAVACVATGVRVTASTDGLDLDGNGYAVSVDGVLAGSLGVNATLEITRLPAGSHVVSLSGVAANCGISGANPVAATVDAGSIVTISFNVSCLAASGVIEVSAITSGAELDPNGYRIQLDSGTSVPLPINGTIAFTGIAAGSHRVAVIDVASNCSAPENPRQVAITVGGAVRDTARAAFVVTCLATKGNIRIRTVTSGAELDPDGYFITVDESCDSYYGYCYGFWSGTVASNSEQAIPDVPVGEHLLTVSGIVRNCTLAGNNPRPVTVGPAATSEVTLDITCVQTGRIAVAVASGGVDFDANGYVLSLTGPISETRGVAVNANVTFETVLPGSYQVSLSGVTLNCALAGPNSRAVTVQGGVSTPVGFDLTCAAAPELAFVSAADGNDEIYRVKVNGAGLTRLTMNSGYDAEPAWSPDGSRIAFETNRNGNHEIYVMNADGTNLIRLTNNTDGDFHPTWSPDGSKIAFISNRAGGIDVWAMNADGSNPIQLTTDGGIASEGAPDWSSNGAIAFERAQGGTPDIWVMDADGANPRQVTTTGSSYHPSWSPDGTRIVYRRDLGCDNYACYSDLFVVNANGSGDASISSAISWPVVDPDWSPDGQWIAFGTQGCSSSYYYYYSYPYCYSVGLAAMHPDGLGYADIFSGPVRSPVWRPGGN